MAVPQASPAQETRTHDHSRALDITICALEEVTCPWCRGFLILLKQHLEIVTFYGEEVLN